MDPILDPDDQRAMRRTAGIDQARASLEDPAAERVWWWLSFVDEDRPEGQRFLGVAIVDAPDVPGAFAGRAWDLGCNPGGQIAAAGPFSQEDIKELVPASYRRRLLTSREDLVAVGADLTHSMPPDEWPA